MDQVCAAQVTAKLAALLQIAGAVQQSGKNVDEKDVTAARDAGATDREIHDTVLIAAAFCMYNRYVNGLGALPPSDPAAYATAAQAVISNGYLGKPAQPAEPEPAR